MISRGRKGPKWPCIACLLSWVDKGPAMGYAGVKPVPGQGRLRQRIIPSLMTKGNYEAGAQTVRREFSSDQLHRQGMFLGTDDWV
jgi:hypothetical protein